MEQIVIASTVCDKLHGNRTCSSRGTNNHDVFRIATKLTIMSEMPCPNTT